MTQDTTIVRVEEVSKIYRKGDHEIRPLDGLSMEVQKGAFVALMGPSGSGKTTLLNVIAGIDRPTSGRVIVAGEEITVLSERRLAAWRTRHVGYIFQLYNLVPVLTAAENVELPLLLLPLSRRERKEQMRTALEVVGVADRASHFPRQLSGGQEQRVAIARALVTDPDILIADEPTGDLDSDTGTEIMEIISQLNSVYGKTVILVTHDMEVAAYAHTHYQLDHGKLKKKEWKRADCVEGETQSAVKETKE
jgi:putative ABC transport system ATP-binding protein